MNRVFIPIQREIYQELVEIAQQLNINNKKSLSKGLGQRLTGLTSEVLQQVFGVLITSDIPNLSAEQVDETTKVLVQVDQQLNKYMPWTISLFSNDRLAPMVEYILKQFIVDQSGRVFLHYAISSALAQRLQQNIESLDVGNPKFIVLMFQDLIEVIDAGVDALICKPKDMLRCNFVVNKTLDGVIQLITSLSYKRIQRLAEHTPIKVAQYYAQHFQGFLRPILSKDI